MTCSPSQSASHSVVPDARAALRARAAEVMDRCPAVLDPWVSGSATAGSPADADAALATRLMDLYRRTNDAEVFEVLVQWVSPQLTARIRSRVRGLPGVDVHEVLQDTIVNVYRYPDRFAANRPGAFAAWSSMIVDNAIRRQLRLKRRGDVAWSSSELLQEQADPAQREPSLAAQDHEECVATVGAFALLLQCYLRAFQTLSERERFVLQMVEVRQMRYAELAVLLGIRHEALKMVVFRARKRLLDRTAERIAPPARLAAPKSAEPLLAIA